MAAKKKVRKKKAVKTGLRKKVKRITRKESIKKRPIKKKKRVAKRAKEKILGIVTHYFPKVNAAVIKLKAPLSVGDTIKIKGHTTDLTQRISSMQINRVSIESAKKGQEIGLLVDSRVRQHDVVQRER